MSENEWWAVDGKLRLKDDFWPVPADLPRGWWGDGGRAPDLILDNYPAWKVADKRYTTCPQGAPV